MKIKKLLSKATSLLLAGALTVSLSATPLVQEVKAADPLVTAKEEQIVGDLLSYWGGHTEGDFNADNGWTASSINADADIERCLTELTELNQGLGEAFTNIMDCWEYADTDMVINHDVLPDGLPTDNSLCIVTLGFQLDQSTGEMQQELIDRLNVALASAKKYPNAYIGVTGGGTSPADPSKTEGGEMAKWLMEKGVDESRIIVETKAPTTVGNATNTFALLKEKPEVTSIAMISSASHVQRGSAIFNAVFQLEAYKANTSAITIVGNAGCPVERKEQLSQQIASVHEAINSCLQSNAELTEAIELSTPVSIELANVESEYLQNAVIEPKVMATFTTAAGKEFKLDVTDHANTEIENIDTSELGIQQIKAKYTYNETTLNTKVQVTIKAETSNVPKLTEQEKAFIRDMLSYYQLHTEGDFNADNGWTASAINGDIDIDRCLAELRAVNPRLGQAFTELMDCWTYADTDMVINHDVLPDGLPTDNSLCIVTLGYQLDQTTGEMQQELIDRLNITLNSARKYPNAYIAVTGGGTSPADPTKTEGEEMAKWLIANGVDASRIIVENKAPNTAGNATNTFNLLKEKPEVTSVAMISSASHVQRGIAIFEAVFQMEAYKANTSPIAIVGNAGCPVERKETLAQQIKSTLQGINFCLDSDIVLLDEIELSTPVAIEFANVEKEYAQNAKAEPRVIVTFKTADGEEFKVDVTDHANTLIENIDTSKLGIQTMKAEFTYNNKTVEVSKEVTVKAAPATTPEKPAQPTAPVKTGDSANVALLFACAALSVMVIASKRKRA